jgi:hypothetical protein
MACLGQSIPLAWKFTAGEKLSYELNQEIKVSAVAADTTRAIAAVNQRLGFSWEVTNVKSPQVAEIALQVTNLDLEASGPDGVPVRFESGSSEEPIGFAAMLVPLGKRLAEATITFEIDHRGQVTRLTIPPSIVEAVESSPGGKKFGTAAGATSWDTLARLGAPLSLPATDLAVGKSWEEKRELDFPELGVVRALFVYTLEGSRAGGKRQLASIGQRMSLQLGAGEDAKSIAPGEETSSGEILFDTAAGRPLSATLEYQLEFQTRKESDEKMRLEQRVEFRGLD